MSDGNTSAINARVRKFGRKTVGYFRAQFHSRSIAFKSALTFPNFLGIGAQKAGTSWLHTNLRHHPQIFMPKTKELHYFDWHLHKSLTTYSRQFAGGEALRRGEITPYSSAMPKWCIRYIHKLMPEAKLILLLRNPIDRAWSQAVMNLVRRRGRNLADVADEKFVDYFRHSRSLTRGDYLGMIDRWLSVYPKERLFVGFFEDIREYPQELLTAIFKHIGVSEDVDWASFPLHKVIHGGVPAPLPPRLRVILEEIYADDIDRIAERFGGWAETWRVK